MREVSDDFLLHMAEVSASLIGLFVEPYSRASTRIVLVLYALPLGLSLSLVALEPVWSRVLFALLSLMLLAVNLDTAARIRAVTRVTGLTALPVNELVGSVAVLVIVALPWVLGGYIRPGRTSPGRQVVNEPGSLVHSDRRPLVRQAHAPARCRIGTVGSRSAGSQGRVCQVTEIRATW